MQKKLWSEFRKIEEEVLERITVKHHQQAVHLKEVPLLPGGMRDVKGAPSEDCKLLQKDGHTLSIREHCFDAYR